jgi:hypothetical protein
MGDSIMAISKTIASDIAFGDRPLGMVASDWRPIVRNSLQRFFNLRLPSGLTLNDCSLHEMNGKRWIGLPSRPQLDAQGRQRVDDVGKKMYAPTVEIHKDTRERFQSAALAAVDKLLGGEP